MPVKLAESKSALHYNTTTL